MRKPNALLLMSLILALCLVLCAAVSASGSSTPEIVASGVCGTNGTSVTWTLDSTGTLTISGAGDMADYNAETIPWRDIKAQIKSAVIADGVTSIGNCTLYGCSDLTSVTIPNSVTNIGISAFNNCSDLASVTIPDSVTSIGSHAFYGCSALTSVTIQEGVTSINDEAFRDCSSLITLTIPDTVSYIGERAFLGCSGLEEASIGNNDGNESTTRIRIAAFAGCNRLKKFVIRKNISLDLNIFSGCRSLKEFEVHGDSLNCCTEDGVLFDKDKTTLLYYPNSRSGICSYVIPSGVMYIGSYAFRSCSNVRNVVIPDSVVRIGYASFEGSGLRNIIMGNGVATIEAWAFKTCQITHIKLPVTINHIDDNAFEYCTNLKKVYYQGNEDQWNSITIDSGNSRLTSASIYYNFTNPYQTYIWFNGDGTELDRRIYFADDEEPTTTMIARKACDDEYFYFFYAWDDGTTSEDGLIKMFSAQFERRAIPSRASAPVIALTSTIPSYGIAHQLSGIVFTRDRSDFEYDAYFVKLYAGSWSTYSLIGQDGSFTLAYQAVADSQLANQQLLEIMILPAGDMELSYSEQKNLAMNYLDYLEVYRAENGTITVSTAHEIPPDLGYTINELQIGSTSATLSLLNRTGEDIEVQFAVAAYNAEGRMIAMNMETKSIERVISRSLTLSYPAESSVTHIKAFVLDNDLRPLRSAWIKEFE